MKKLLLALLALPFFYTLNALASEAPNCEGRLNPLLQPYNTPMGAVPFDRIRSDDYIPALQSAYEDWKRELQRIADNPLPASFENTLLPLELIGQRFERIALLFNNQNEVEKEDSFEAIAEELAKLSAKMTLDTYGNTRLFERIEAVWRQRSERSASAQLKVEERRLLDQTYVDFVREGARLSTSDKEKIAQNEGEIEELGNKFTTNLVKARKEYRLHVTDASRLRGVPEHVLESCAELAKKEGKDGWIITLQPPITGPIMELGDDASLRQEIHLASSRLGRTEPYDNEPLLRRIAQLRHQNARLKGFINHADYVIQSRMAGSPMTVREFLGKVRQKAKPVAEREFAELAALKQELTGSQETLQPWDTAYYSEKLRQKKHNFDSEALRPYFQYEKVMEGIFALAQRLYGLSFTPTQVPVYHADVKAYEVRNTRHNGELIGLMYVDLFPREGRKSQGAWMTSYQNGDLDQLPHVAFVGNMTPSTPSKPALLSFDEVETVFHEFGHGLHGLLGRARYQSMSGTNVKWDFVELPSQFMERFLREKEVLDTFATHYETGAPIPAELLKGMRDSENFGRGLMVYRQTGLAFLDLNWHSVDPSQITSIADFEEKILQPFVKPVPGATMSTGFSHIFAGGYSAGYYSYLWSDMLAADAFEAFREEGVFNPATALRFQEEILSRGGSREESEQFRAFRGRDPQLDALFRAWGF